MISPRWQAAQSAGLSASLRSWRNHIIVGSLGCCDSAMGYILVNHFLVYKLRLRRTFRLLLILIPYHNLCNPSRAVCYNFILIFAWKLHNECSGYRLWWTLTCTGLEGISIVNCQLRFCRSWQCRNCNGASSRKCCDIRC